MFSDERFTPSAEWFLCNPNPKLYPLLNYNLPSMKPTPTIILPGLDGTGLLLDRFRELAPETHDAIVCALPDNPNDNYPTLCDHFSERVQELESCHLIAESFSGPLGILLAHRHPEIIRRLTLVATFAVSPTPLLARFIPWSILYRLPMPSLAARHFFVGPDENLAADLKNAIRQTSPQALVSRMHCLMNVDVTTQLSELNCEVKYIRPKQDRLVQARSLKSITAANPTVSVRDIDGPHLILQTRPKQAWELLLN